MKISKIELYNIGPYVGQNIFDLDISSDRNIVLIGGENGAGKTTFFRSIKAGLYGCKAWNFDAPGKEYYSIIGNLINNKIQYSSEAKAYIRLFLYFDDGKDPVTYIVHREWSRSRRHLSERLKVFRNEAELSDEQLYDFDSFLLSLIPPDMFNFYFFDGESIADFFLGNDGDKNFRNAFLKLYGLDTLSLIVSNFYRHCKKNSADSHIHKSYQTAKQNLAEAESAANVSANHIANLEHQLDALKVSVAALEESYLKEGGMTPEKWKSVNSQMLKEESLREDLNRRIKELANNYLPFFILKDQLDTLKQSLIREQENQGARYAKEMLSGSVFSDQLAQQIRADKMPVSPDWIISTISEILDAGKTPSVFDFSQSQLNRVMSQIEEKLSFDGCEIYTLTDSLNQSLQRTKQLRDLLAGSSIEGYEEYVSSLEKLEKNILNISLELEGVRRRHEEDETEYLEAKKRFEKEKSNYETLLRSKSITDISSRAVAAFSLLEEKLIKMQSSLLEREFQTCFSKIINKENFIDGIVVDDNINVIPYKMVTIDQQEIHNYVAERKKDGFLDLFETDYTGKINQLLNSELLYTILPSPITAEFSKGERQVYIMSIYLALLKTSKRDIPFFIDTPFARIDANHREKIVSEFFKGISNQLFILSTDEEIVDGFVDLISDKISDKYLLNIDGYGQTSLIKDAYFGETIT